MENPLFWEVNLRRENKTAFLLLGEEKASGLQKARREERLVVSSFRRVKH